MNCRRVETRHQIALMDEGRSGKAGGCGDASPGDGFGGGKGARVEKIRRELSHGRKMKEWKKEGEERKDGWIGMQPRQKGRGKGRGGEDEDG